MTSQEEQSLAPLGVLLRQARNDKGLSLRDVERLTDGRVKNSYLCHVETGRIEKPSVDALHELSAVYRVPYSDLLRVAGYHVPTDDPDAAPLGAAGVLLNAQMAELTEDELADILEYVQLVKKRRSRRDS